MFELSAFLSSHKEDKEDKEGRIHSLVVKPLGLATITTCWVLGGLLFGIVEISMPSNLGSIGPFGLRGAYVFGFAILANVIMKRYWKQISVAEEAFSSFTWDGLKCQCCEINHVVNGVSIACDRDMIADCVCQWFGSIDAFETCVRTEVREVFLAQLVKGISVLAGEVLKLKESTSPILPNSVLLRLWQKTLLYQIK